MRLPFPDLFYRTDNPRPSLIIRSLGRSRDVWDHLDELAMDMEGNGAICFVNCLFTALVGNRAWSHSSPLACVSVFTSEQELEEG